MHRPARVVGYFPRVPVEVDEDPGVAAPERLAGFAPDGRPRGAGSIDHLIHLLTRSGAVGEGDPAPATADLDCAVLRELLAAPERDDHAAGLEEDDIVVWGRAGLPAEVLVELPGSTEIRDSERDEAESLFHLDPPFVGLGAKLSGQLSIALNISD